MADESRLLAPFIVSLRSDAVLQKSLARELGVSSSYISQVESGTTIPSEEKLVDFARALGAKDRLSEFLLRAAHDRTADPVARQTYARLVQDLSASALAIQSSAPRRTLEFFPRAFEPMVIVTGDKREDPPKTPGDVGALSASPIDDRYLREIPLSRDTDKISDKVFVLADKKYLRRRFGRTNLLVVGSPASNHLARIVNGMALYRFAFDARTAFDIEKTIEDAATAMQEQGLSGLKVFRDREMADLKFIMNELKQGGIFDPLPESRSLRARSLRDGVDFATVTIARHPYSESNDFVAIMAAGFHLPGTVQAVRFLSNALQFADRPFGGVIEVRMTEASWYERIEKADVAWDTEEYTAANMIEAMEKVASNPLWPVADDDDDEKARGKRDKEAQELKGLLSDLLKQVERVPLRGSSGLPE